MAVNKLADPVTNLNGVTATGAGAAINGSRGNGSTWSIVASGVTTGGTMLIQASLDGTNYGTVSSTAVSANGTTIVSLTGRYPYMRSNLSARTDGTYTTQCAQWIEE